MSFLIDSYSTSYRVGNYALRSTGNTKFAHSFTGANATLSNVNLVISKFNSPTGPVTVSVYDIVGTLSSCLPTGDPLITSDTIMSSALPTSLTKTTFNFSTSLNLTTSYYAFAIEFSGGDLTNLVSLGYDSVSKLHPGVDSYMQEAISTSWVSIASDLVFEVWGDAMPATISGVSTIQGISQITL